jgi:predicted dehydrogenase
VSTSPLRIAMIGHAFMGAAHSHAWRTVGRVFELDRPIDLRLLCGRDPVATAASAARLGWAEHGTDWRQAVERDDIDVVDICTPVGSHADIAVAALAAGKHVLCEKPLGLDLAAAQRMATAAERAQAAGTLNLLGHNYRRVPALARLRDLVEGGELGTVRHLRIAYLQDWGADAEVPMSWRFRAADGGSGALADLGSHIVDLTHFLTGRRLTTVSALRRTFVTDRPDPDGGPRVPVDVDDAVWWTAELDGGAVASFEVSRVATGRRNGLELEIFGDRGSAAFDLQRLNELDVGGTADAAARRRVLVTEPTDPYLAAWWPPGHVLGWDHTFVHQARDFVAAIADGVPPSPGFADGLAIQQVLTAVGRSADTGRREVVG